MIKRALTTFAVLSLVLGGCDHADEPGPGFMSGAGMTSGASTASAAYGMNDGSATFGLSPSGELPATDFEDWIEIPQGPPITVDDGVLSGDYGHINIPSPTIDSPPTNDDYQRAMPTALPRSNSGHRRSFL